MRYRALLLCMVFAGRAAAEPAQGWVKSDNEGAVCADNPAATERIQFGNTFQNTGLDQWCDQVPYTLPISQDMVEQLGAVQILNGGAFNGNRQFFRYPDGDVSINDQLEIKLDLGVALAIVSRVEKVMGIFFGGSIDGQSLVTRPMHTSDSCKEMKRFLNPFNFKTVLPLNAKRLGQMDIGELWIIPMTFQIAFEPLDAAAAPSMGRLKKMPASAYISLGTSKTTDPTITVFRVGPKEMRLKLHLDQVKAYNVHVGGVFGPIPATDIGTPGLETLLSRILPTTLPSSLLLFSRQIDGILGIQAGVGASHTAGQQVLLEYTLDPTDPEQMANLAKVIKGDLSAIQAIKDFTKLKHEDASSPAMLTKLDDMKTAHDNALRLAADLAGIDDYKTQTKSGNFSVPVVLGYTRSTTVSQDHYVTDDKDINSRKILKQSNLGFISFPVIGSFINTSHAQGAQVLVDNSDSAGEAKGKPYLIYTQEWGLLRAKQSVIGKAVKQADALVSSVGAGSGPNPLTRLPDELRSSVDAAHYHKGYLDLSLVLSPQAVQQAIAASAQAVIGAFDHVLTGGSRDLFDFILAKSKVGEDGSIAFDRKDLNSYPGYDTSRHIDQMQISSLASSLCKKATSLFQELSALRAVAQDPESQAEGLFRLASGKGSVSREDFFKIAVQLVSADDIGGDVILHLDAEKTSAANYTVRYILNPTVFGDAVLKGMAKVERGFVAPTPAAPLND